MYYSDKAKKVEEEINLAMSEIADQKSITYAYFRGNERY